MYNNQIEELHFTLDQFEKILCYLQQHPNEGLQIDGGHNASKYPMLRSDIESAMKKFGVGFTITPPRDPKDANDKGLKIWSDYHVGSGYGDAIAVIHGVFKVTNPATVQGTLFNTNNNAGSSSTTTLANLINQSPSNSK